jgi:hypothetical protein
MKKSWLSFIVSMVMVNILWAWAPQTPLTGSSGTHGKMAKAILTQCNPDIVTAFQKTGWNLERVISYADNCDGDPVGVFVGDFPYSEKEVFPGWGSIGDFTKFQNDFLSYAIAGRKQVAPGRWVDLNGQQVYPSASDLKDPVWRSRNKWKEPTYYEGEKLFGIFLHKIADCSVPTTHSPAGEFCNKSPIDEASFEAMAIGDNPLQEATQERYPIIGSGNEAIDWNNYCALFKNDMRVYAQEFCNHIVDTWYAGTTSSWISYRCFRADYKLANLVVLKYIISSKEYTNGGSGKWAGYKVYAGSNYHFAQAWEGIWPSWGERVCVGDFNGDGLSDLFMTSINNNWQGYKVYVSNGAGFSQLCSGSWPSWGDQISVGDFNGDGKSDLFIRGTNNNWQGYKVYTSTGTGFSQTSSGSWPSWGDRICAGDYNGDGKCDLFITGVGNNWQGYKVYTCSGTSFSQTSSGSWPSWGDRIWNGDYNGDGRSDLFITGTNNNWQGYKVYASNGNSFYQLCSGTWPSWGDMVCPGDYDGDGKYDIFITGVNNNWQGYQVCYSTGSGFTKKVQGTWPAWGDRLLAGKFTYGNYQSIFFTQLP